MDKDRRKRIVKDRGELVKDELSFEKNMCSEKARQDESLQQRIIFDLWYDKHYLDRNQLGEDDGTKREGIDLDAVRKLVTLGLSHLLFYSAKVKRFSFLNHELPKGNRALRTVLNDMFSKNLPLNIIIEVHFKSFNRYEVTIITALCKHDFDISDGQYAIQFLSERNSVLNFKDKDSIREIYSCQD